MLRCVIQPPLAHGVKGKLWRVRPGEHLVRTQSSSVALNQLILPLKATINFSLGPEQEALCERLEKGESTPSAAALIRRQAREIDDLWDRLSHAYALVRRESPGEMIHDEMEQLRAMLDDRRQLQTSG